MTNKNSDNQARKQTLKGVVVANSLLDTITVEVVSLKKHDKYQKYFKKSKRYLVHAPKHTVQVGDTVNIIACKPMSKRKRFELIT